MGGGGVEAVVGPLTVEMFPVAEIVDERLALLQPDVTARVVKATPPRTIPVLLKNSLRVIVLESISVSSRDRKYFLISPHPLLRNFSYAKCYYV